MFSIEEPNEYNTLLITSNILNNQEECDKVLKPKFYNQNIYETIDEILITIKRGQHV